MKCTTLALLALGALPLLSFAPAPDAVEVACQCAPRAYGIFTNDGQAATYTGRIFNVTGYPKPGECSPMPACAPVDGAKCEWSISYQILKSATGIPIQGPNGTGTAGGTHQTTAECGKRKSLDVVGMDGDTQVDWTIYFVCDSCNPTPQETDPAATEG